MSTVTLRDFEHFARADLSRAIHVVSDTEESNQKTWQVFRTLITDAIGVEKFNWICRRYNIDYSANEARGVPFLGRHVEMFSVGASQHLVQDVRRLCQGRKVKELSRSELQEKLKASSMRGELFSAPLEPRNISGPPTIFRAHFKHDTLLMDREKIALFSDVSTLSPLAFEERLARTICNREFIEGQIIPAPGRDGALDYYRVHKKIGTGDGLVAYAFKPVTQDSSLKPLLVFRPSQYALSGEDSIQTLLEDVEKHVGRKSYLAAKPDLDQLMQDPSFLRPEQKLCILGYSLGGAHAQWFLTDNHPKIVSADFFSDPSVDAETAERFAAEMGRYPRRDEPLTIKIIRTRNDYVHYAGEKHIGFGVNHPDVNIEVYEIVCKDKTIPALYLHSFRIFDNDRRDYTMSSLRNSPEIDAYLDNSQRGAKVIWYEKWRRVWGRAVYAYLYAISQVIKGFQTLFHFRILRSSGDR